MPRADELAAAIELRADAGSLVRVVVLVEIDGRAAKATVGCRDAGGVDVAGIASACFAAIAAASPGRDLPRDRTLSNGIDP